MALRSCALLAAYIFAVIAAILQLVGAVMCGKMFLDELQLGPEDKVALSEDTNIDHSGRVWLPFKTSLDAFKCTLWMLVLVNMTRGLCAAIELVGGLTKHHELLIAFRALSRLFQAFEILLLLVIFYAWKVPMNVGQMQSKLAIECIVIGAEMLQRELLLAALGVLAARSQQEQRHEDGAPTKDAELPSASSGRVAGADQPPAYCHVVAEGLENSPPPPYNSGMVDAM